MKNYFDKVEVLRLELRYNIPLGIYAYNKVNQKIKKIISIFIAIGYCVTE